MSLTTLKYGSQWLLKHHNDELMNDCVFQIHVLATGFLLPGDIECDNVPWIETHGSIIFGMFGQNVYKPVNKIKNELCCDNGIFFFSFFFN